ncbi:LXG domain-containing protein [Sporosarcina sp. 179-K 3D1 HS]|uniref:ribonuclease YeeF family protein n=1 Tax=Sporosarcina sp. 179-K 3D1 HS TaxID=3232169 RepID=UPI0039A02AE1
MKILTVSTFSDGLQKNLEMLDRLEGEIQQIDMAVQKLVGMDDALKGKGGSAIRSYYQECHLPLLQFLQLFKSNFYSVLTQMNAALDALEPNPDGYIQESFLEGDVEEALTDISQLTTGLTDEANAITAKVADIVALPQFNDSDVQSGIDTAKKRRDRTIADLNMFDSTQTDSLASVESDLLTMELWLMDIQSLMEDNLTDISFPVDQWATYAAKTPLQVVMDHRTTPVGGTLASGEKKEEVGNGYFNLEDLQGLKKAAADSTAQERITAVDKTVEELAQGNIKWQSDNGKHVISTGVPVNYNALGVETDSIDLFGYEVRYTVQDGQFILFKDNPQLHYYTQGAEQGKFNYYAGKTTQAVANLYGTLGMMKVLGKVPGVNMAADLINKKAPTAGSIGKGVASYEIQSRVPIWGEIIGTSVPAVGSKEIILYISEDGEEWPRRVRFVVSPEGVVAPHKWEVK